jgi:hypothetical protein
MIAKLVDKKLCLLYEGVALGLRYHQLYRTGATQIQKAVGYTLAMVTL